MDHIRYAVAACQTDLPNPVERGAMRANTDRMLDMIDSAVAGSAPFVPVRLVVFPEFAHAAPVFPTVDEILQKLAVEIPNDHTDRLTAKAREHNLYIQSGSMLEEDRHWPGVVFNTTCLIGPRGILYKYRKVNPWIPYEVHSSPHDLPGYDEPLFPVAETPIGRIGCAICYDWLFPEAIRQLTANGAEVLVRVSAYMDPWGATEPMNWWTIINRARAIENTDLNIASGDFWLNQAFPNSGATATEKYDKLTGGRGIPDTASQRIAAEAFPFGIMGMAAQATEEAGEALNIPPEIRAPLSLLVGIASERAPSAAGKAAKKILNKAQSVGVKTGKNPLEIVAEAQKTSGADLEKVAAGDAKEINKLNRAISGEKPAIAKKVEELPKKFFDKKSAIKEREAFGAKLPESPFNEYFSSEAREAKKISGKKPETLAKEAENAARIRPLEEKVSQRLQDERNQLRELEKSKRGLQGNALDRVEASVALKGRQIEKTLDELRDIRYELKYNRKRPTEAEIDADIKKSGEEFAKEAKNPTPAGQKKIAEQLKQDKQYIDRAEELAARGELPGEIRPDTHIKIKQKYLEGYNAMIQELREGIKSLKGARDAESLNKISADKKTIEYLQGRQQRLKADIINQTDKIKAMKAIEGPSGAFYREQLKGLQKDVAQFQHDFFKQHKHLKSSQQLKTEKVVQPKIKEATEATKLGEEVGRNPTQENIAKAAEQIGENPQGLKKETEKLGDVFKERAKKLEAGKATEADVQKTEKQIDGFLRIKMNLGSAGAHFFVGALTGVIEHEMDIKIPRTYLYGGASLAYGGTDVFRGTQRSPGRTIGFGAGHSFVNYIYNTKEAAKLKELRQKGPNEYSEYVASLKKRYSAQRVNKIIEKSK